MALWGVLKLGVLLACAVPAAFLWWAAIQGQLGANPAEALIRGLGDWTLRLLCVTLAITPLRVLTGWARLASWRRGLGLWTFAYACQHLLAYVWLDMGADAAEVWYDVLQRPFIWVGMAAWLGLLPLATTSFNRAIKTLGAARWQRLHRLVYGVALLAVLHFYWMRAGKQLFGEVYVYAALLALLIGWRVWRRVPARGRGVAP